MHNANGSSTVCQSSVGYTKLLMIYFVLADSIIARRNYRFRHTNVSNYQTCTLHCTSVRLSVSHDRAPALRRTDALLPRARTSTHYVIRRLVSACLRLCRKWRVNCMLKANSIYSNVQVRVFPLLTTIYWKYILEFS